jgi:hypothetical protein
VSGSVGAGESYVLVSHHLQELPAGTTYHYRVVTHNEGGGTVEGPDHTFTTQTAGGLELTLPDGRAWELVSPPDKKGALIELPGLGRNGADIQAANAGNAISYVASAPIGEDGEGRTGGFSGEQVFSARGPSGWRSQTLNPRLGPPSYEELGASGREFRVFSSDLSSAVVEPPETSSASAPLSPGATERTLYLRDDATGSYLPLVTEANVPPGTKFGGSIDGQTGMVFLGATPDLSHVVLGSPLVLTPEAFSGVSLCSGGLCRPIENLYEWSGGRLQLVNILPNEQPTHGTSNNFLADQDHVEFGGARSNGVSSDGRRIVWYHGEPLYVRDMVEGKTVQIGGNHDPVFQTMSSDGSRIFFLESGELYEFDSETGVQTDLTGNHGAAEHDAGVQNAVLGASEDGSYVYFVANGVLSKSANARGEIATRGSCANEGKAPAGTTCNLYLLHYSGGEWEAPTFVASLSSEDRNSWFARGSFSELELSEVSSRVSPDGRYVAFMSERSLTGYDNIDANSGKPDEEVYLYDAVSGRLVCASCDPTGARPVGVLDAQGHGLLVDPTRFWGGDEEYLGGPGEHWLAGFLPGWSEVEKDVHQPRYLSDSGRLFFDSPDALVPHDTNGLMDVYEYEPGGIGGCTVTQATFSERSGGCVNLISSGTSSQESAFLDASENGDDAFFITAGKLVPEDREGGHSVYDAHVCSTEAPCVAAPVSPPPCTTGDSCKAAPSPQPGIFGAPASATFSGAGNVVPSSTTVAPKKAKKKKKKKTVRCAKGKKLSHGKCVKAKTKSKRKAKAKKSSNNRRASR